MLGCLVNLLTLSSLCLSSHFGEIGKELEKQGLDVDKIHAELKRESAEVEEEFAAKETQEELAKLRAAYISSTNRTIEVETELEINRKLPQDLFQGDIMLTPEQWGRVLDRDSIGLRPHALTDVVKLWTPMGAPVIPYSYTVGFDSEHKKIITDTLKFWASRTCINFRRARETDQNFIEFNDSTDECSSSLGMVGGKQRINLSARCISMHTATHQLSHAFGTLHVQSRSDRDDYIIVDKDNIYEDVQHNFVKNPPRLGMGNYSVPYEFGSVMHYDNKAYAVDQSKPTIYAKPRYSKYQGSMGSHPPSFYDTLLINKMYKCTAKCEEEISCENNGVQDGNDCNRCFCPKGWTGARCEKRPRTAKVIKLNDSREIEMEVPAASGFAEELYVIEAPIGKKIKASVKKIEEYERIVCADYHQYFEIFPSEDTRMAGIRFCEKPDPTPIESDSNQMLVWMYNDDWRRLRTQISFTIV